MVTVKPIIATEPATSAEGSMTTAAATLSSAAPAPNDTRFAGKTIVITGAGGQFGRAGCLYFAQRGARIAALDVNAKALEETYQALCESIASFSDNKSTVGKLPLDFVAFTCNVTDVQEVRSVMASIAERWDGTIDLLWNNAGYQGKIMTTLEYDPQDFANVMNINVTGMFHVLQAAATYMAKKKENAEQDKKDNSTTIPRSYCSIVNTASVAGLRGTPGMIAYSTSKAAVIAMTITAAKDLACHDIRVNAVSPALIGPGYMWDRQNQLHAQLGPPYFASKPEQVALNKINSVPLKRLGSVEEVIQSVAFLLSSDSSYTTGTNVVVDGGMAAGIKA